MDEDYEYEDNYNGYEEEGYGQGYEQGQQVYPDDPPIQHPVEISNHEPYEILPLVKIYEDLHLILADINTLVYLDKGWCLLLLKEFKWDKDILKEEYYNRMDKYLKTIGRRQGLLSPSECGKGTGTCDVCLSDNVMIMQNICKHSFCVDCWLGNMKGALSSGNPFVRCMGDNCGSPILLQTALAIFEMGGEEGLHWRNKYDKKVCELLVMENRNYKFCTGVDCGNCIKINELSIDTVTCKCGKTFCFRCQSDDHYPCKCEQKAKWVQQVISEEADAKWISNNAKICPWCKKAVERSMGCNFMACTCGKSFCYMCSKPWEPDHKDHFKCHIYRKRPEEELNREKEIMERLNHCTERYIFNQSVANNYKQIDVFAKRKYLFKVIGIELTDSQFMEIAYRFAIECCEKLKWIYAFTYFTDMKAKKDAFQFSLGEYEKYKENLLKLLAADLKMFIGQVQTAQKVAVQKAGYINKATIEYLNGKFKGLKKVIVNLYTCTKNYKDKFVQELRQVTEIMDLEKEQEEMKNYKPLERVKSQDKKIQEEPGIIENLLTWGKGKKKNKKSNQK